MRGEPRGIARTSKPTVANSCPPVKRTILPPLLVSHNGVKLSRSTQLWFTLSFLKSCVDSFERLL